LIAGNISLKQKEKQEEPEVVVKDGLITTFRSKTVVEPNETEIRSTENQPNTKEEVNESVKVEVDKENITTIDERVESKKEEIIIDSASGETIPPIEVHHSPGVYEEHHDITPEVAKKIEPKYDYDAEFAFAEKKKEKGLDGGAF
jgi:iron uptake system EfeUOB component EfeO/EfeM